MRTNAKFRVFSDELNSSAISARLQLSPMKTYDKGTPVSWSHPGGPFRKYTAWILSSGISDSESLSAHLANLIEVLEERLDQLQSASGLCRYDFFCGLHGDGRPLEDVVLPAGIVRWCSEHGMALNLDRYLYTEANDTAEGDECVSSERPDYALAFMQPIGNLKDIPILTSDLPQEAPYDEHIERVLSLVRLNAPVSESTLYEVVLVERSQPFQHGLTLSTKTLHMLAEIGAGVRLRF